MQRRLKFTTVVVLLAALAAFAATPAFAHVTAISVHERGTITDGGVVVSGRVICPAWEGTALITVSLDEQALVATGFGAPGQTRTISTLTAVACQMGGASWQATLPTLVGSSGPTPINVKVEAHTVDQDPPATTRARVMAEASECFCGTS